MRLNRIWIPFTSCSDSTPISNGSSLRTEKTRKPQSKFWSKNMRLQKNCWINWKKLSHQCSFFWTDMASPILRRRSWQLKVSVASHILNTSSHNLLVMKRQHLTFSEMADAHLKYIRRFSKNDLKDSKFTYKSLNSQKQRFHCMEIGFLSCHFGISDFPTKLDNSIFWAFKQDRSVPGKLRPVSTLTPGQGCPGNCSRPGFF